MAPSRVFASVCTLLIVGWCLAVTVQVLGDEQVPADMALSIILAAAIIPSLIGVCILGLLWPVVAQDMTDDRPGYAGERLGQGAEGAGPRSLECTARG